MLTGLQVGDVVVPLVERDLMKRLTPGVPHVVVGRIESTVWAVRQVVHAQLVAGALVTEQDFMPYQVMLPESAWRRATLADVDDEVRFRIGSGRVHEVVAGRTVCPESGRRRALVPRLEPTSDPVDCRVCLRIGVSREAVGA